MGIYKCFFCVQYIQCKKIYTINGKENHFRYKHQAQIHTPVTKANALHKEFSWKWNPSGNLIGQTISHRLPVLCCAYNYKLHHLRTLIWFMYAVTLHRLCIIAIKCLLSFVNISTVQHRSILLLKPT